MKKKYVIASKFDWKCAYCGEKLNKETLRIDHVVPRIKNGSNDIENLMPACNRCNSSKGAKSLEEYRLYLSFKEAVKEPHFSQGQINFLKDNGLLEQLGVTEMFKFSFERAEAQQ